jgi:hypothetical protein
MRSRKRCSTAGWGAGRPLMARSGHSIEHLVLTLGAYPAAVPIVPVSTAYSLLCADDEHIRAVAELCRPGPGVSAPQRTSGRADVLAMSGG